MQADLLQGFRIGPWTVEPLQGQITGPDARARHLQPKVMEVLVCLAAHANEPVTRDDLLTAVWGERAVSDEPLTHAISELRRALEDDRSDPRYIETIPKRGYRLIGPVELPERVSATTAAPRRKISRVIRPGAHALIALLAAALVSIAYNTWWDAEPAEKSIAVLPFQNLSGDPDQEYFSDGVSEEVLNLLAQVPELRVISRSSSFSFKDKNIDIPSIAEQLNVTHVLDGSVRRDGDQLRITAQLIEVRSDSHLWAQSYDREFNDIFAMQGEIARSVVKALEVTLLDSQERRLAQRYIPRPEAYERLILGRYEMAKRTEESLAIAAQQFKQAIGLDPGYALPYVALADTYQLQQFHGGLVLEESLHLRQPLVDKALELDPFSGEAYTAKAILRRHQQIKTGYDYFDEEADLLKAIALNPNYASARHWYATLLNGQGRVEEALTQIRVAAELDPMSPVIQLVVASVTWNSGRAEEAMELMRRNVERTPEFANHYGHMARRLTQLGRLGEAQRWLLEARKLNPKGPVIWNQECLGHLGLGDPLAAEDCVNRFVDAEPENLYALFLRVPIHVYRDEWSEAIATLEAYRERLPGWRPYSRILAILVARQGDIRRARQLMADAYPEFLQQDIEVRKGAGYDEEMFAALVFAAILNATGETQQRDVLLDAMEEQISTMHRIHGVGYGVLDVYVHAIRGDTDEALARLREAIDMGWKTAYPMMDTSWWMLNKDWRLESVHQEPDFIAMVNELEADIRKQRQWYEDHKDQPLF